MEKRIYDEQNGLWYELQGCLLYTSDAADE